MYTRWGVGGLEGVPEYDSFCRPMNFSVFVCASWKSICLFKSFIYIHRHFLDALN